MNNIEQQIQQMISDELDKRQAKSELTPIALFCKKNNISRTTLWRAEKSGQLKTCRIGRRVFVKGSQF